METPLKNTDIRNEKENAESSSSKICHRTPSSILKDARRQHTSVAGALMEIAHNEMDRIITRSRSMKSVLTPNKKSTPCYQESSRYGCSPGIRNGTSRKKRSNNSVEVNEKVSENNKQDFFQSNSPVEMETLSSCSPSKKRKLNVSTLTAKLKNKTRKVAINSAMGIQSFFSPTISKSYSAKMAGQTTDNLTVFGVPLKSLIERERILYPSISIPIFARKAIDYLILHGINEKGIFRISGNFQQMTILQNAIDEGKLTSLDGFDCHVVAGLLKKFFRELPNSLLTSELYLQWVACTRMFAYYCSSIADISTVQSILSMWNRCLAKEFFRLLFVISKNDSINCMNASNLATTNGPNLLFCSVEIPEKSTNAITMSPENAMREISEKQRVVKALIEHFQEIFTGEEELKLQQDQWKQMDLNAELSERNDDPTLAELKSFASNVSMVS